MVQRPPKKPINHLKWLLTLLWVLLSLSLLFFASLYQWNNYSNNKQNEIQEFADEVRVKIDDLIGVSSELAQKNKWYKKEQWNCKKEVLPIFTKLLFNNPDISGAIITNQNNEVICSTYNSTITLPQPSKKTISIIGPFALDKDNKEVFLIQHNLGKYYLGLYVIKKVIENNLSIPVINDKTISIYDQIQKKYLIQMNPENSKGKHSNHVSTPLHSINHFLIIISTNPPLYSKDFLMEEIPIIILLSLLSIFLYYKIRHLMTNRFSLRYAMTNAINNNLFEPAYQLLWDDSKAHYCGAEVLIRWRTQSDEIIMPDAFIEEAEKTGLIGPMTLQLMEKAFTEFADFLHKNPDFHLAFNLSSHHFLDRHFVTKVRKYCESFNLRPQQIMFELTERELLDQNNPQFVKTMTQFRNQGYSLAIDDFGTGHASIKYLQHFPFNYLKIDKIFIQAIGTGAITETLNTAIIQMARCLRLEVIAEGVETLEQFNFLRSQQITLMQGWYFSKSASFENIISILEPKSI